MRLIDVDKALELFREEYEKTERLIRQGETQLDSLAEGFTEAAHIIRWLVPTVDAVPVVRCKDCVHWREAVTNDKGFLICPASGMEITESDFCSYGEREETK